MEKLARAGLFEGTLVISSAACCCKTFQLIDLIYSSIEVIMPIWRYDSNGDVQIPDDESSASSASDSCSEWETRPLALVLGADALLIDPY